MCDHKNCTIHQRVDSLPPVIDGVWGATTYVGDKLVFSTDNPDFGDPVKAISNALNGVAPTIFVTYVLRLDGDEMSAANLLTMTPEEYGERILFKQTHTQFSDEDNQSIEYDGADPNEILTKKVHDYHSMVVDGVRSGLIAS